jgi:hypothetical protein
MSESQEQQQETAAPKKARKSERRETAPVATVETANAAEAAAPEIKPASNEVAASEPAQAPLRPRRLVPDLAQAAAVLVALGAGWAAGHAATAMSRPPGADAREALTAIDWAGLASGLQKAQGDTMRMAADLQALKGTLAGLKEAADRSRQDAAGRLGQLAARLEHIEKTGQEVAAKVAGMAERFETSEREASGRLASVLERLERNDRPASAQAAAAPKALLEAALQPPAPAASAAPAAPATPAVDPALRTGSIPEQNTAEGGKPEQPKNEAKATPIEGWVLREVYDGVALIEGRNRRLLEIAPGQSLSGIGRVESIERRGRSWVVVTTRGVITSQPW